MAQLTPHYTLLEYIWRVHRTALKLNLTYKEAVSVTHLPSDLSRTVILQHVANPDTVRRARKYMESRDATSS